MLTIGKNLVVAGLVLPKFTTSVEHVSTPFQPIDMRKFTFSLLFFAALFTWGLAQNVTVSGALLGNGSYPTLTAAFAALNGGSQAGANITVALLNDTWEGSGTALLNAGTWASITMVPVGQPRTIAGATTAGQPMVDLNGADRVTFAGLIGGQKGLTFFNNSTASTQGTSTIRLRADAQYNSFTHCKVLGASTTQLTHAGGNLVLLEGTNGGNSDNVIDHCDFGPGDNNLPSKCIYNRGVMYTFANMNQDNTVSNCHFYDCFSETQTSCGIILNDGGLAWQIDSCRFYQNALRTKILGNGHYDVQVLSMTADFGHVISNSIFGTRPTPVPSRSHFEWRHVNAFYVPISFAGASLVGGNSALYNHIQDIWIESIPLTGGGGGFTGIANGGSNGGAVGNVVGSTTDDSSIVVIGRHSVATGAGGITGGNGDYQSYSDNLIGGIQVHNIAGGVAYFNGFRMTGWNAIVDITDNTIGFASAPIQVQATGTGGSMYGIYASAGSLVIERNTVSNMYSNQTSPVSSGNFPGYQYLGIHANNGYLGTGRLRTNTVHSIVGTNTEGPSGICGIHTEGVEDISNNHIHSLYLPTEHSGSVLVGLDIWEGPKDVFNNMIRLGFSPDGTPITTGISIYGIHNKIARPRIEYNSVYVGGTGVRDTSDTYAIYSMAGTPQMRLLNNIFFNARSNGSGSGTHYAITHGGQPNNLPMALSDGNVLFAPGVGGKVGLIAGVDLPSIFDWRLATGQDFNSIANDPNFIHPTGGALTGDLHIGPVSPVEGLGVAGSFVFFDFDFQVRPSFTPRDIGADAGNFTPVSVLDPEVELRGNTLLVVDGDVTPSNLDGTDFGAALGCGSGGVVRTYQLRNIGNGNLVISGTSVLGAGFSVSPLSVTTLIPGQTVNVNVQFTGAATGAYSATVTLLSNDLDEGVYTFDVQAVALGDTIAPTAVCQPVTVPVAANGAAVVNASALGSASTDNCAIATYSASPAQFTCAQIGPQAVQLSVADPAGNTASCNGMVTVVDALAPQAVCQPASLTLGASGSVQLTAAAIDGGSTDNCAIDSLWAGTTQFTCAQIGTNTVLLSVRDAAGNTGTCTATVTVSDNLAPVALCQPATLNLNNAGQAQLPPVLIDGGSTDNCGIATRLPSQVLFTCADVGVRPVTLTVTDLYGNSATCSTQVMVQDLVAPVLTCANLSITLPSSGPAIITPGMVGTATDACGIASYQLSQTQFSCPNVGSSPVRLIALDVNGNADTCLVVLTATATPLVLVSNPLLAGPCGHHVPCAGQAVGSATASASGACAPYTYTWSNGQAGATATGLSAGQHTVTVTSANGQQQVQTVTLTAPAPLTASVAVTPSCSSSNTGSLSATAAGGQACQAYSYLWSTGATTTSLAGLAPGTYLLTLTDAAGCTDTASATITNWPASSVAITQNLGTLVATPGFVAYQWYNTVGAIPGATGGQFTPLANGSYSVVATDVNGCTWTSASFPFTFVGAAAALPGWADIRLYPNPGRGVFQFAVGQVLEGPLWLSVTDLSGKVLYQEALSVLQGGEVFDLSAVAAGVYVVELRGAEGQTLHFRLLRE